MANNGMPVLPDIDFVETDAQEIIDQIIKGYEEIAGARLADGDPRRLFLLSLAYIIVHQRQQINLAGKSNLLYYAKGEYLDHIGLSRRVERLQAEGAVTTIRFTLSAARPSPVGIPEGTRVTSDGELFWATTQPATIMPGSLSVDVPARAMTPGSFANGLEPGEINQLVDPIPFVASVENIDETQGGHDRESDDAYRKRIYNAPAAFSTAGPEEAYKFWAFAASGAIVDVEARSPSPGVAEIRPLLRGGVIPDQVILDAVYDALSPSHIRPLCDQVIVLPPEPVEYAVEFTYYIRRADQGSADTIQQRVSDAVAEYVEWQRSKLGRDINPDELITRVRAAGAKRLVIDNPSFRQLDRHEVAQETAVIINYGGVEDE